MTTKAQEAKAVAAVERHGALLVYPMANRRANPPPCGRRYIHEAP